MPKAKSAKKSSKGVAKKTTRKTARKATKKAAKKSAEKATKTTTKKTPKKTSAGRSTGTWTSVRGTWTFPRGHVVQRDPQGTTSCFQRRAFQDFTASFSMTLTGSADQIQAEAKFLFSDGSDPDQPYRIDFIYKVGLCRITAGRFQVGALLRLVEGKEHRVTVRVYRNLLDVEVDGFTVFHEFQFGKRTDGRLGFGTYNGTARFERVDIMALDSRSCFIIMPFDQKRDFLYEYVLRPMLQEHSRFRFEFEKGDEALTVNRISQDIVDAIQGSELIIADVTERNPNVFYEVGYSHCRDKKTILLVETVPGQRMALPFDTQDFRHEPYHFSKEGFEKLRKRLDRLVVSLLA